MNIGIFMDNEDAKDLIKIDFDLLIDCLKSIGLNNELLESIAFSISHKSNKDKKDMWNGIEDENALSSFQDFSFNNLQYDSSQELVNVPCIVFKGLIYSLKKNCKFLNENPEIIEAYSYLFFASEEIEDTLFGLYYPNGCHLIASTINIISTVMQLKGNAHNSGMILLKKITFEKTLSNIQQLLICIERNILKKSYDGVLDNIINDFQKTIVELYGFSIQFDNIQRTQEQQENARKITSETEENLKPIMVMIVR